MKKVIVMSDAIVVAISMYKETTLVTPGLMPIDNTMKEIIDAITAHREIAKGLTFCRMIKIKHMLFIVFPALICIFAAYRLIYQLWVQSVSCIDFV